MMRNLSIDRHKLFEIGLLLAVTAAVVWTLHSVPSWRDGVAAPSLLAALASVGVVAFLWVSLWRGQRSPVTGSKPDGAAGEKNYRPIHTERLLFAAFLCGMPFVYVAQYLTAANAKPGGWLWLEVAGIPIFATLALLGVKISPWFLVIGIAAHGVGWDSWHYRNSAYIPDWYSISCLLVDITIGAYAAVRIPMRLRA